MLEKEIENYLAKEIKKIGGLCYKFVSPGNDGVPDRIAILPDGQIWFIELKAESGRLSPIQVWQIDRLRQLGVNVAVIRGKEGGIDWLTERRMELAQEGYEV